MTQTQAVMRYMLDKGSITSMEAITNFGCTRLSAKIFVIKKLGAEIETKTLESYNRFGNLTRFTRYSFADKEKAEEVYKTFMRSGRKKKENNDGADV